ncbi:MAG: hypothetical protein ACREBD_24125 [Blastocatellia bacterium]
MNRFLLCTLVCEAAREIGARTTRGGAGSQVMMIARNVLRSYLVGAASRPEYPLEPDPVEPDPAGSDPVGPDPGIPGLWHSSRPLNEEEMSRVIDLHLQAVLKQTQTWRAEERRLDIESIVSAAEPRRIR